MIVTSFVTMAQPRAPRRPPHDWEKYKEIIIHLYKDMTLEAMRTYMIEKYQFTASKRQYVFKFEKWGVRKYRSVSTAQDADMQTGASSARLEDEENHQGEIARAPDEWESQLLKADFLAAMSDNAGAFPIYCDIAEPYSSSSSPADRIFLHRVDVARAQTSKTIHHARREQDIVEGHPGSDSETVIPPQLLKFASTTERDEAASISDLQALHSEPPSQPNGVEQFRSMNLVDFALFWHRLVPSGATGSTLPVAAALTPSESQSKKEVWDAYLETQPLGRALLKGDFGVHKSVPRCLRWCRDKLKGTPEIPSSILEIQGGHATDDWKENIAVFCCLWLEWWRDKQADSNPHWAKDSYGDLGISFSYLLFALCYLLMDESRKTEMSDAAHSAEDPNNAPESSRLAPAALIKQAREGVECLIGQGDEYLWKQFIRKFLWLNEATSRDESECAFEKDMFQRARAFIDGLLHAGTLGALSDADEDVSMDDAPREAGEEMDQDAAHDSLEFH